MGLILETRDLTKRFGGFLAVDGVNLKVEEGAIHALIGPNGAGKTTTFNLLTKFLQPTSGLILFKDRDITSAQPQDLPKAGIVRSFQISAVFGEMTVLHNVRVALQTKLRIALQFWRPLSSLSELNDKADSLLEAVGLLDFRHLKAKELSYGRKRALEIATTLAMDPELLLLDEPTSGLGHEDVDRIAALIQSFARNRTLLMVEHNLSVVSSLCDTITVLTRGKVLIEGDYATVSRNPAVIEAYLGTGHE